MNSQIPADQNALSSDVMAVRALYERLLDAWNKRSAADFAALFADDANLIGFDGSQMNGQPDVRSQLAQIFADHQTAAYVAKIRETRFLTSEVALLRSVVGMVPPGGSDINPAVNAVQTLVATRHGAGWRIALFQNTPAQFHGNPALAQALTEELRQLLG